MKSKRKMIRGKTQTRTTKKKKLDVTQKPQHQWEVKALFSFLGIFEHLKKVPCPVSHCRCGRVPQKGFQFSLFGKMVGWRP